MNLESLPDRQRIAKKNMPIIDDAPARGDDADVKRLYTTLHISADIALRVKRIYGADRVREMGMRTDRAEAALGPDWLGE